MMNTKRFENADVVRAIEAGLALNEYPDMVRTIKETPGEIRRQVEEARKQKLLLVAYFPSAKLRSQVNEEARRYDTTPDEVLEKMYSDCEDAMDYVDWIHSATDQLFDKDRLVLQQFFGAPCLKDRASLTLSGAMNVSEKTVYNHLNDTLCRIGKKLFKEAK